MPKKKKENFQSLGNAIVPVRNKDQIGHEKWKGDPHCVA